MRILIIVGGFFPAKNYGGPSVSIDNLCTLIQDDKNECYIITTDHDHKSKERLDGIEEGWNIRKNCSVLYLREREINYNNLLKIVLDIRPNLLYINSLFTAKFTIPLLRISMKKNIPVLLAPRGELCKNALKKKYKKIPYMILVKAMQKKLKIFYQSTSDEETIAINKWMAVDKRYIYQLKNIPTIPSKKVVRNFKRKGVLNCIFLSRIVEKKNLVGALHLLSKLSGEVNLDIYGPIEDVRYWSQCKKVIASLPDNINVEYKGIVGRDKIHETFAKYDIFLFPTFSENYGHVIVESMVSGCPVILSDQTPWSDIQEAGAGWAFPLSEEDKFVSILQCLVDMDYLEYNKLLRRCLAYINKKLMILEIKKSYIEAFHSIISDN